jgi:Transposase.
MKKSKFTPEQMAEILKEFDQGKKVEEITREYGISRAAFYKWRQRYGGLKAIENLQRRFFSKNIYFLKTHGLKLSNCLF